MSHNLPDKLQGHWMTDEGAAMAREVAVFDRDDLSFGILSDFEFANAIFMADRNAPDLITYQTGAKARIRWLSVQVALAQAEAKLYRDSYSKAVETMTPIMQNGGEFAHLLTVGDSIVNDGPKALVKEIHRLQSIVTDLVAAAEGVEKPLAPFVDAKRSRPDFIIAVNAFRTAISHAKETK